MSDRCRRRPRGSTSTDRGTTLIEVLLGLVILSTLLVSVAMARGRFLRQWADADRRVDQVHAADQLMSRWLAGPPSSIPLEGTGDVDGLAWQTHVVPSTNARNLGAVVVRLAVFDRARLAAQGVSVDFLVHDARVPTTRAAGR